MLEPSKSFTSKKDSYLMLEMLGRCLKLQGEERYVRPTQKEVRGDTKENAQRLDVLVRPSPVYSPEGVIFKTLHTLAGWGSCGFGGTFCLELCFHTDP